MSLFPQHLHPVRIPPLKCQGIKTRLVPFIASQIRWSPRSPSRWIEPFLGSGVVAFNLAPARALLADSNPHIIRFYRAIQQQQITRATVQHFLQQEGQQLCTIGADYYYTVRDRFNQTQDSLDFLFLNRACFNGLMRFNRQGHFNVPFCRKPQRFSPSYITKIANQVQWVAQQIQTHDWEFQVAPWPVTLAQATATDFVYLDPPYIGRHADYCTPWEQADAEALALAAQALPGGFAASMWLHNQYRQNAHVAACWAATECRVQAHFYHVGAKELWRGAIAEALLIKPGYAAYPMTEPDFCQKTDEAAIALAYGEDEHS